MRLSEGTIRDRLDHWPVARLATLGPDRHPHQVPIVFARVGEELWSPVDGKPKSGGELVRVKNARERPDVSLLLDEYASDWSRLWWIRIDATARVVGAEAAGFTDAVSALRAKYTQYADIPVTLEPPTLLVFQPRRIRSWSGA